MTPRQAQFLRDLLEEWNFFYIEGSDVTVARNLAKLGLVELEDNGPMILSGRSDGERWAVTITDAGRATYAALVALEDRR